MTIFIKINYEKTDNKLKYISVAITSPRGQKEFKMFDFVKDWFNMREHIRIKFSKSDMAVYTPTVYEFTENSPEYESVEVFGVEYFIPKGSGWTWGDLVEHCTK